jgi:transposase
MPLSVCAAWNSSWCCAAIRMRGAFSSRSSRYKLALIVPSWSMAPVVEAYQAMRGASFLVAVIVAAEIGDVRRFETPRQLMSFLGLVPAESSTGDRVRRKGLTLAGNRRARRALVEAAWTYRYPARVSETLRVRLDGLPKAVRDIAWKAQVRLAGWRHCLQSLGAVPRSGNRCAAA